MSVETSVVVPVYGSEPILPQLVERVHAALGPSGNGFELVLVNDCSPDGSWRVISELCASRTWVKGVALRRNAGQHNALMAGLRLSRGKYVVMMDDDLQHDPADIPRIIEQLRNGHDACYARFRNRQHAYWKRAGSKINDWVAGWLLGKPRDLYLSPFKGIVGEVRDEVVRFRGPHVYLDGLILSATSDIVSIELDHHARPDGQSGYSLRKSISLWLKMATSFSVVPLRVASVMGMMFSALGFLAAVALVVQRFTINAMPVGWSSLIVSILILGGIQLMALGLIGEYVGRVLLHVNERPQVVVGDTLNIVKGAGDDPA